MDASTNGLDPNRLGRASALGTWLTDWEDLSLRYADADELRDLAVSYRKTGYGSKAVRTRLRDAARLIDHGESAANRRGYQTASSKYREATALLRDIAPLIRKDLRTAEKSSGGRLSPRAGTWFEGYDHLFPVETKSEKVTVKAWIDGDTVQTSAGRVRLIGVDTPEMSDPCSRARSAKQHAESLAPAGSTIVLRNPASVVDSDRYRRLLRYVDIAPTTGPEQTVIDVGFSQLKASLATARYDSRDGYQWHPREQAYRQASNGAVESDQCKSREKAIVAAAATLSDDKRSPEYWRHRILGAALLKPYNSAKKHLPRLVAQTRKEHEEEDRLERELEREDSYDSGDSGDSGGGDDYSGYNGPRCYAPGGKTWTPC